MTNRELGIARGYGGIWNNIPSPKTVTPVYKYDSVLDYDFDCSPLYGDSPEVAERKSAKRRKNYVIVGETLWKLIRPDAELNPCFKGVDPMEKRDAEEKYWAERNAAKLAARIA